jgi:sec-independent protein translocase protein TatA
LVVLLLFGAKKLPELARSLGKASKEFKAGADEVKREIEDAASSVEDDNEI